MSDFLFVYGTLLKNADNDMSDYLFKNSKYISSGFFYGKLFNVSWYPGAILSNCSDDKVFGSIFKLKDADNILKILDDYEGIDEQLYRRELINVFRDDEELKCWVYLYNRPITNLQQIVSGNFLEP